MISNVSRSPLIHPRLQRVKQGYTLIEVAIAIAIIFILSTLAIFKFNRIAEDRDAAMVQSVQSALQSIYNEASTNMNMPPDNLERNKVLKALQKTFSVTDQADQPIVGAPIILSDTGSFYVLEIKNKSTTTSPLNTTVQYKLDHGQVLIKSITPALDQYILSEGGDLVRK